MFFKIMLVLIVLIIGSAVFVGVMNGMEAAKCRKAGGEPVYVGRGVACFEPGVVRKVR